MKSIGCLLLMLCVVPVLAACSDTAENRASGGSGIEESNNGAKNTVAAGNPLTGALIDGVDSPAITTGQVNLNDTVWQ